MIRRADWGTTCRGTIAAHEAGEQSREPWTHAELQLKVDELKAKADYETKVMIGAGEISTQDYGDMFDDLLSEYIAEEANAHGDTWEETYREALEWLR